MKIFLFLLACTSALVAETNVLVFSGSTRNDSYNKKLAFEAAAVAKELGANVTLVDLKNYSMPLYDGDLELKGIPKNAKKLGDLMAANDAIVIASPEHNASVSAVLKNALDWVSRGGGAAVKGKKIALMSASPGRLGGARGLLHLSTIMEEIGGQVIEKQVVVPAAHQVFGSDDLSGLKAKLQEQLEMLLND